MAHSPVVAPEGLSITPPAISSHVCPLAPTLPVFGPLKNKPGLLRTMSEPRKVVAPTLLQGVRSANVGVVEVQMTATGPAGMSPRENAVPLMRVIVPAGSPCTASVGLPIG